jgi:hypothetical protein
MTEHTRLDEAVPLWKADKPTWPRGVRTIGQDELDCLGIDRRGHIYWDGKPVEVRHLTLSPWQRFWVAVVSLFLVAGGLGSCVQGFVSYQDWACSTGRPAFAACPVEEERPD